MADLRKIHGSPLEISPDATVEQLQEAMGRRYKIIAAISDVITQPISGREITPDMRAQLGQAMELLNAEADAMEKILVEH